MRTVSFSPTGIPTRTCSVVAKQGIRLTRDSWPDDRRDLKCRKARPQRPRLQMSEALMLQSVPPYVDTPQSKADLVPLHFDDDYGVTNDAIVGDALLGVSLD